MRNDVQIARANGLMGAGRLAEAIAVLNEAARIEPRDHRAHHMLGVALAQAGQFEAGEKALKKAHKLSPKSGSVLCDHATLLILAKRNAEALPLLEQARRLEPGLASALFYHGVVLTNLERPEEALRAYDALLKREPRNPLALQNRAALLLKLKRCDDALAAVDALLALSPQHPPALALKASVLAEQMRYADALALCDAALARDPKLADAHHTRGVALTRLGETAAGVAALTRAIELKPDFAGAWLNQARVQRVNWKLEEAGEAYQHLLAIEPNNDQARIEFASTLSLLGMHGEAAGLLAEVYANAPETPFVLGQLIHARRHMCDWRDIDAQLGQLCAAIDADRLASPPFPLLALDIGPDRLRRATVRYANYCFPSAPAFPARRAGAGERIRVAYLSGEFRDQATAYLMAEVYESHDSARFEIFGVDTGPRGEGDMRQRLEKAFGGIRPMGGATDTEIARWLNDEKIDIAVDLNGWFGEGRHGVFAMRPCPVQVNYLGLPGTLGSDYYDYIVGDSDVTPRGSDSECVENIVRLPECYQPNDSRRAIDAHIPARKDLGLPEHGFVFCCFNNNHKIEPIMFDPWMRLLRQVEGSVLWLVIRNDAAQRNLILEAGKRGVDPRRLVFAPYAKLSEHLARHARADLFLDTLPHNAHTTASDSLWAGVPVLTCVGDTFAGRVGASLLRAVNLPELVTHTLADYEALALKLARDPALLGGYRARLAANRLTSPLFNGARYTRHLERAFEEMVAISRRGEPPRSFDVEAMD